MLEVFGEYYDKIHGFLSDTGNDGLIIGGVFVILLLLNLYGWLKRKTAVQKKYEEIDTLSSSEEWPIFTASGRKRNDDDGILGM